ncbi:MAG TPA: RsbRD N-terminal domain-containing protein [Pyrinomonadaceae bacterium]|nr:RsbRD N-terminal domain-containing protein [Pyrinomonadaceae bacterium]
MPERFISLFRQQTDALARAWVDGVYADQRTHLPSLLSYRQLVEHLPEVLEELGRLLDSAASYAEILEAVSRLRFHAQVRFQQGALVDEVARELIILRGTVCDFLWREGGSATEGAIWGLRDALRRTDCFVDELIAQTVLIYAASLRPNVPTRTSTWPPPRRRKTDFPVSDER